MNEPPTKNYTPSSCGVYFTIPNMSSCGDISKGIFMGGGIYLAIPDMPGCVDITESICVGGGIYPEFPVEC